MLMLSFMFVAFCVGDAVQHLGCFSEKLNKYELQTELIDGELLELINTMTVDQCVNR